jgi:hypothetical protein
MKIDGVVYTVKGMIEFRQGSYAWKEYALSDSGGKRWWLSVEGDESISACSLFRVIETDFFTPDEKVVYEGRTYTRRESGRAEVIDSFGLSEVQVADGVEFEEYGDDSGLLLSRERWSDRVEYSAGAELPKDRILVDDGAFVAGPKKAPPEISYRKMTSLPLGQELRIRGTNYSIEGIVRYRQDGFTWTEYKVGSGSHRAEEWLCVEQTSGNECALSLHSPAFFSAAGRPGQSVVYSGVTYDRVEEGKGEVTEFDGDVDFDEGEVFAFVEFRSRDNGILTLEYWGGEQEASLGTELKPSEVTVLDSQKRAPLARLFTHRTSLTANLMKVLLVLSFALPLALTFFSSSAAAPLIKKQLESSSLFAPVTSVTLQGGKKAQVYSTSLSLEEACLAVIRMDPENIRYVTTAAEDAEKGERMVETSRETVMIYESESGETYVQVSENESREGSYTAYRPRSARRALGLYYGSRRWYRSGQRTMSQSIDTGRYTPAVASARQASVSARRSSGGGSHFGK